MRANRVADTELVEHVRVRRGQVGDRVVGQDQPLEHRLVHHAADVLLVTPQGLELRLGDRRSDELLVDRVEVDRAAAAVGLDTEGHDDKAERGKRGGQCGVILARPAQRPRLDARAPGEGGSSAMPDWSELLCDHRPLLVYDSRETYFADAASSLVGNASAPDRARRHPAGRSRPGLNAR